MVIIISAMAATFCCVQETRAFKANLAQRQLDAITFPQKTQSEPKIKNVEAPEIYIEPTIKYGLNFALPKAVKKNLSYDVGYDRHEGLPTGRLDYFIPIKKWSDRSIFFNPRVSLSSSKESFSLGMGTRHMITAKSMVGFHVFHDMTRNRRERGEFLRQIGLGAELSLLPGKHSDLTMSLNTYFPGNERFRLKKDPNVLVREILPTGYDAKIDFLLPALFKTIDIRLSGSGHSYRANSTDLSGYTADLNFRSRDGLWSATAEKSAESRSGDNYKVEGAINLAFDWSKLLEGANPFSAPYSVPDMRFDRKVHDSLYQKAVRKHDLPMDRTETKVTLLAQVNDDEVSFSGIFPHLAHSPVVLQTSRSPWADFVEVATDGLGAYSGQVKMPPGVYRIRLLHKASGRVSNMKTVVVEDKSL